MSMPENFDADVWNSLPEDIRQEILREHNQTTSTTTSTSNNLSDETSTGPRNGGEVDISSFLASLEPEFRNQVLITFPPEEVERLPPDLRSEVDRLRHQAAVEQGTDDRRSRNNDRPAESQENIAPTTSRNLISRQANRSEDLSAKEINGKCALRSNQDATRLITLFEASQPKSLSRRKLQIILTSLTLQKDSQEMIVRAVLNSVTNFRRKLNLSTLNFLGKIFASQPEASKNAVKNHSIELLKLLTRIKFTTSEDSNMDCELTNGILSALAPVTANLTKIDGIDESSALDALSKLLSWDDCPENTFILASKVAKNLVSAEPTRMNLLLNELVVGTELLGQQVAKDLHEITERLKIGGSAEDEAVKMSELRLLRVVKTIKNLKGSSLFPLHLEETWTELSVALKIMGDRVLVANNLETSSSMAPHANETETTDIQETNVIDAQEGEGVEETISTDHTARVEEGEGQQHSEQAEGFEEEDENEASENEEDDGEEGEELPGDDEDDDDEEEEEPVRMADFFHSHHLHDDEENDGEDPEGDSADEEEEDDEDSGNINVMETLSNIMASRVRHRRDGHGSSRVSVPGLARFLPCIEAFFDATEDESVVEKFGEEHSTVLNALVRNSTNVLNESLSALVSRPGCRRVLTFDNKRSYFKNGMRQLPKPSSGIRLQLRRDHIIEDSLAQLNKKSAEDMRGPLSVAFRGEEGIDAGGVTREWFEILIREIFKPGYALFKQSADSSGFQPDPRSYVNSEHLSFFKFVGRVIGKALADQHLIAAHFTRSFYKHMLGREITLFDLQSLDPQYHKSLQSILDMEDVSLLDIYFTADIEAFGVRSTIELIPNGSKIQVTEANKQEWVRLSAHQKMTTAIKAQINAFLAGFYELIPQELIRIFNPQEVELLLSGMPKIDLEDLRRNTEYHGGFNADSVQIQWFWKVLKSLSQEDRARFLMFVTGTSMVPLEGFSNLVGMRGIQRFSIHRGPTSDETLPSAHTCFNQLDLPAYSTEEIMRQKLTLAIREGSEGFGFA